MKSVLILMSIISVLSLTNTTTAKADTDLDGEETSVGTVLDPGVASFCHDRLSILRQSKRAAEYQTSIGNALESANILLKGLQNASLRISPMYRNTLTAKAIVRGVAMTQKLNASTKDRQKVKSINHYLLSYYDFVKDVSEQLDIPYYRPRCGFCNVNADEEFERNFVAFAQEQMNMVLESMTTTNGDVIYPVGSPRVLLTALQWSTHAMAKDLGESLDGAYYSCTINELLSISSEAAQYLKGGSYMPDDFVAIQELVGRAKEVSDNMGNQCGASDDE